MNQETGITLHNVLTENDLCELLGMKKSQIADLRNLKGLPFIKLGRNNRLYFEQDVIAFFRQQRMVLNRSELES